MNIRYSRKKMINKDDLVVGIVGLGYVGLPLSLAFGEKVKTIGFDVNKKRVRDLKSGIDETSEISYEMLSLSRSLEFTDDEEMLFDINVYIVTVPTPIDEIKNPDLNLLQVASETIAKYLKPGDIVVYESTVYPGLTEEFCIPILEKNSNLKCGKDGDDNGLIYDADKVFYVGYSPERINPGDENRSLVDIVKVVSGSNSYARDKISAIYSLIIKAGIHLAPSIKVAEAAKVIENTQRDLNIAFFNELSIIFSKLGICTHDVIDAAKTKWNFLALEPGLVGGHCIGVDPYYLAKKTLDIGLEPKLILAGRSVNEGMVFHVIDRINAELGRNNVSLINASKVRVLILGLTFKENVSDIRNSKSIELFYKLVEFGYDVHVHDPHVSKDDLNATLSDKFLPDLSSSSFFDVVVVSVPHKVYKDSATEIFSLIDKSRKSIIFDLRGIFRKNKSADNNYLSYLTL
jgi:UDP-N-acetyl-D-galactosamine dehydrogenase